MRSLVIAAIRLFALVYVLIQLMMAIFFLASAIGSDYRDLGITLNILPPYLGTMALSVLVFWIAPWLARIVTGPDDNATSLHISPRTIVASGLILFGVFGVIGQFLQSLAFCFDLVIGQPTSFDWPRSSAGQPAGPAMFSVVRLIVYGLCVLMSGRIADVTTRGLTSPAVFGHDCGGANKDS